MMSQAARGKAQTALLVGLYALLCAVEWLCSKARQHIESLLFPPKEAAGGSK